MQHAVLMSVLDCLGYRSNHFGRAPGRERSLGQSLRQISTRNKTHGQKILAVMNAGFVDRHNVRMLEPRRGLRFGLKAIHSFSRRQGAAGEQLEGDNSLCAELTGLVHDAHPSPTCLA
jgi:hypothetical protein